MPLARLVVDVREIVYFHFDNFYTIACRPSGGEEERLIVLQRGCVLEASSGARACGVQRGMPVRQARRLCPQAVTVDFAPELCEPLYHQVWSLAAEHSPLVEPVDRHAGFIDLTGCLHREETAEQRARCLAETIARVCGVRGRYGGGPNRFIARLTGEREQFIGAAQVASFLHALPVTTLDEIDVRVRERLQRLGIHTLADLAAMPEAVLVRFFGSIGALLHQRAHGIDLTPVAALYPPPREVVIHSFAPAEEREGPLLLALQRLRERLWAGLQARGQVTHRLSLTLRQPRAVITQEHHCARGFATASHLALTIENLFRDSWHGEPLVELQLIAHELERPETVQFQLWEPQRTIPTSDLEVTVERLRRRFGHACILTGSEYLQMHPPRFAEQVLRLAAETAVSSRPS